MEPNPLAIFVLCLGGAAALIFLLWLNHKWVTRRRPKSAEEEAPTIVSRPIAEASPAVRPSLVTIVMSYLLGAAGPIEPVADRLHATPQSEVQGVANTRNPVNTELPAQGVAQGVLPEEARDIIKFWARVEAVERIVAGGKVGMVEAIELIFECKRNGRPDSVYGRARAAIQARERPQYIHQLTPEQKRLREELALE